MIKNLKVLFISHESSLTGAPILLLSLLKLLKKNTSHNLSICIKRGGQLDKTFSSVANTIIIKPQGYQLNKSIFKKFIDYIKYRKKLLQLLNINRQTDLIISNTVTNGRLLKYLSKKKTPTIVYIHELESVMKLANQFKDVDYSLKFADAFFSPAPVITHNLTNTHNVPLHKIFPLNYYFPPINTKINIKKKDFFLKYKIPGRKFYIAGCGTANYRKGIDVFIEACGILNDIEPDIYFVWIGDFIENEVKDEMNKKIRDNNINNITITGFVPHSPDNFSPFNLLALTSREDPYPVVVLEAAQLKIPTIGFRGTGGIDDFINDDAGFLLEERTASALANKIIYLKNNKELLKEKGEYAKQKVIELHGDPLLIITQFNKATEHLLNERK